MKEKEGIERGRKMGENGKEKKGRERKGEKQGIQAGRGEGCLLVLKENRRPCSYDRSHLTQCHN